MAGPSSKHTVISAFFLPLRALKIMWLHRPLLWAVWFPLVLGSALYAMTFYFIWGHAPGWIEGWLPNKDHWIGLVLYDVTWVLLTILVIAAGALFYGTFGRILLAPFSEMICRRTEEYLNLSNVDSLSIKETVRDVPRLVKVELGKLLFSGVVLGILLIVTTLIPPAGFVSSVVSVWLLAFQYVDYPFELRRISFIKRIQWSVRHSLSVLAFGVILMFLISIPILGILGLPAGIIGGTLLYHEIEGHGT